MTEKKYRGKVIVAGQLNAGGGTNYTRVSDIGDISQGGSASADLGRTSMGGATNYTLVDASGQISQGGTASAAMGDVTVGGGTSLSAILVGSISPCFNAIAVGASGTGSATITGLTTGHKIFVSPCCLEDISPCLVHISTCPAANKVLIGLQNSASGAQTSSATCPWAYLAISHA